MAAHAVDGGQVDDAGERILEEGVLRRLDDVERHREDDDEDDEEEAAAAADAFAVFVAQLSKLRAGADVGVRIGATNLEGRH